MEEICGVGVADEFGVVVIKVEVVANVGRRREMTEIAARGEESGLAAIACSFSACCSDVGAMDGRRWWTKGLGFRGRGSRGTEKTPYYFLFWSFDLLASPAPSTVTPTSPLACPNSPGSTTMHVAE